MAGTTTPVMIAASTGKIAEAICMSGGTRPSTAGTSGKMAVTSDRNTGASAAMIASVILVLTMGLNLGIDFRGGTTIRAESSTNFEVGDYRAALEPVVEGDLSITEVFDPTFGPDRHVAQVRIGLTDEAGSITPEQLNEYQAALQEIAELLDADWLPGTALADS